MPNPVDPPQTHADELKSSGLKATLPRIKAKVICGAANNQLANNAIGDEVAKRGILYAPDYVINAGGIINVIAEYLGNGDGASVARAISHIESRLADIFVEADRSGRATDAVADSMARRLIGRE